METITLSKEKYYELVEKAALYDRFRQQYGNEVFACPPVKDADRVMESFAKTGLYSKNFLESFKKGLGRSSYFKHENPASSSRTTRLSEKKKSCGKIRQTKTDF